VTGNTFSSSVDLRRSAILPRTLDFDIAHLLPADPDTVADVLLDEDFQASLSAVGALRQREVLSQKTATNGTVTRRIRCVLGIDLGAASKFLGDAEPAWVEEARWDPKAMLWSWTIHPEVAEELIESKGTTGVEADDGGAVRRVSGNVKVKVPIYGSKVEGRIVRGLTAAYDEEADRLHDWLEG
jgi:hypothetical protein